MRKKRSKKVKKESNGDIENSGKYRRVGLIFDERMCKHYDPYDEDHPECPDRIKIIWDLLNSSGLAKRCIILNAKDAKDNHLALIHTKKHIDLIKNISSKNSKSKRKRVAAKFDSIYFNEGSTEAAYLAAGSVIEAAEKVAKGKLDSAFAIVRPPGHHAEEGEPMGFCLYNNVGIATSYLLNERKELGINKILIVDWDVHHGNGTQKMFYKDPRVLFFSVHRYENGTFYPGGQDGSYIMTGEDLGAGHNINVPWEHGRCGDADYLAVWDHILIPVAKKFNPDMILISAGFDAAKGDPLGDCCISPYGYSVMLDKLMEFAGGKIVMALEGGYNLNSIASSAQACVEVLLNEKPSRVVLGAHPFAATWRVIQEVRRQLSPYWPVLAVELPKKMICKTSQIEILSSDSEAEVENITLTVSEEVQTTGDDSNMNKRAPPSGSHQTPSKRSKTVLGSELENRSDSSGYVLRDQTSSPLEKLPPKECLSLLQDLPIPQDKEGCPEVKLNSAHRLTHFPGAQRELSGYDDSSLNEELASKDKEMEKLVKSLSAAKNQVKEIAEKNRELVAAYKELKSKDRDSVESVKKLTALFEENALLSGLNADLSSYLHREEVGRIEELGICL